MIRRKTHRIKSIISIAVIAAMLLGLASCRPALNSHVRVEDEISKLNNVERNIYVSGNKDYEAIANYLQYIATESDFKGSMIAATDDEIIFAAGTGLLDVDGNEATPYTTYEIGSNTKSFTAVCIMSLIEKKKLSMDKTIGELFPEYSSYPSYEKISVINVSDLLHMRSGLADYVNDPVDFIGEEKLYEICGPNPDNNLIYAEAYRMIETAFDDELFLERLFTLEPLSEPGVEFVYNNTNYHLLALIVERVSGKAFEDYLNEVVFGPCNMKNTSADSSVEVTASYEYSEELDYLSDPEFQMGAGGIRSNVADMLKFDRALFGGYILNEKSMDELLTPVDGYACGWQIRDGFVYHCGDVPRFSTSNYIIERDGKRIYIILMANLKGDYRSVIPKNIDMMF